MVVVGQPKSIPARLHVTNSAPLSARDEALPETDPVNIEVTSNRVIRGGSWGDTPQYCRSASRNIAGPEASSTTQGLRLVRSVF